MAERVLSLGEPFFQNSQTADIAEAVIGLEIFENAALTDNALLLAQNRIEVEVAGTDDALREGVFGFVESQSEGRLYDSLPKRWIFSNLRGAVLGQALDQGANAALDFFSLGQVKVDNREFFLDLCRDLEDRGEHEDMLSTMLLRLELFS